VCGVRASDRVQEQSALKGGWNSGFNKAHSILRKVSKIIKWGNSDNTSCQSAERAHIALIKVVAGCTNNKNVFVCILRFHARSAYLQLLQELNATRKQRPQVILSLNK
jgi:hypothetical protein